MGYKWASDIRISDKHVTVRLLDEVSQTPQTLSEWRDEVTVPVDETRVPLGKYMYYVQFLGGPLANTWVWVDKEDVQPTFKKITAANEDEYRNRRAVVEADRCEIGSKITLSFYRECPGCGQVSRISWRIRPEKAVIVAKITELSERIK